MQCDIQLAAEHIQAPDKLKVAVVGLLHAHAGEEAGTRGEASLGAAAAGGGDDAATQR